MTSKERLDDASRSADDWPRRLWEEWQAVSPPDLVVFLAAAGSLAPLTLATVVRVDQRERWGRGDRRLAEQYLEMLPALQAHEEAMLDVVVAEFLLRVELGEAPTAAEYAARFPDHAAVLADHFELASVLDSPSSSASSLSRANANRPSSSDRPMSVRLTVTSGPSEGKSFQFATHDTFVVGRSERAHFRLPEDDPHVSRNHFLIEVNPPWCRLLDLGSRNGTFVNGRKVAEADLLHGDLIQGGRTIFRVDVVAARADATPHILSPARRSSPSKRLGTAAAAPGENVVAAPSSLRSPTSSDKGAATDPPQIPGYRILRELGRGAMGVVLLARRDADGLDVAIKTIAPSRNTTVKDVGRLLREADILRQLDHPHIVRFLDLGEANGVLWFAMEYVGGENAAQRLNAEGKIAIPQAVDWVDQLLVALAHAHARGYVHRDVKPSNLMVSPDGEHGFVSLTDFGLARVYQASTLSGLTLEGQMGGTLSFMPPEQLTDFRNVNPAADQYSAAATLYNLLSGKAPFDFPNEVSKCLALILSAKPVPLRRRRSEIPVPLEAALNRALSKEPSERFSDVEEFRKALKAALPEPPRGTPPGR